MDSMSAHDENPDDPWLTLAEIADELRLRPVTVRSWIAKGQLRAMRAGRRKWVVRRSELDRMLDRQAADEGGFDDVPTVFAEDVPDYVWEEQAERHRTDQAQERGVWLASAEAEWEEALEQSRMAPPDARFSRRIRHIAVTASARSAWMQEQLDEEPESTWTPSARSRLAALSYELRPGGRRPGPRDAWRHFDQAVERLGEALQGASLVAVQSAFAEVAAVMTEIADALDGRRPRGAAPSLPRDEQTDAPRDAGGAAP